MKTTEQMKEIGMIYARCYKMNPTIKRVQHKITGKMVDLAHMEDFPAEDVNSYGTIGLINCDIGYKSEDKPLRIEFIGAAHKQFDRYHDIIEDCALNMMDVQATCFPGAIYLDMVRNTYPLYEVKHILFMEPFLWGKMFGTLDFGDNKLTWLQAIPITDEEAKYAREKGINVLMGIFEKEKIDVLDLKRKSVV